MCFCILSRSPCCRLLSSSTFLFPQSCRRTQRSRRRRAILEYLESLAMKKVKILSGKTHSASRTGTVAPSAQCSRWCGVSLRRFSLWLISKTYDPTYSCVDRRRCFFANSSFLWIVMVVILFGSRRREICVRKVMNTYLRVYALKNPRIEIYVSRMKLNKHAGFVGIFNVRSKMPDQGARKGKMRNPTKDPFSFCSQDLESKIQFVLKILKSFSFCSRNQRGNNWLEGPARFEKRREIGTQSCPDIVSVRLRAAELEHIIDIT